MPIKPEQDAQLSNVLDSRGQSFIEFIFLLTTLVVIGFVMLRGFNSGIAIYWQGIVQVVVDQNPPVSIELR